MKKAIDILFFIFYNNQYLDGRNKTNKTPWIGALGLLMGGTSVWLLLLFEIYCFLLGEAFPPHFEFYCLLLLTLIFYLLYNSYVKDKNYLVVYERYKYLNIGRKSNIGLVLSYIFIPIICLVLLALKHHHKI
jgi:hypothetical protein